MSRSSKVAKVVKGVDAPSTPQYGILDVDLLPAFAGGLHYLSIARPLVNINDLSSCDESQLQALLSCTRKGDGEYTGVAKHFAQAIAHARSQGVTFKSHDDVRKHLRDKPLAACGISGEDSHKKLLVDGLVFDERIVYDWK